MLVVFFSECWYKTLIMKLCLGLDNKWIYLYWILLKLEEIK